MFANTHSHGGLVGWFHKKIFFYKLDEIPRPAKKNSCFAYMPKQHESCESISKENFSLELNGMSRYSQNIFVN